MSETVPEPAAAPQQRSGGNVFTRRIGPLPMWAWVAIVSAALLGWSYFRSRQQSQAQAQQQDTGTPAADVPQFVNQTYTTVTPPEAAPMGPAGPAGPPGKAAAAPKRQPYGYYKVLATGPTPSLAAIAKQYGTTPAAIEATTRKYGTPGTALQHYFNARKWNAPLPHGSNIYYPQLGGPYSLPAGA